jgi:hypothetical protein
MGDTAPGNLYSGSALMSGTSRKTAGDGQPQGMRRQLEGSAFPSIPFEHLSQLASALTVNKKLNRIQEGTFYQEHEFRLDLTSQFSVRPLKCLLKPLALLSDHPTRCHEIPHALAFDVSSNVRGRRDGT